MSRIRSIKPQFFTSEQVADCSMTARLAFIGMWCFCDDYGIHPASSARLKMEVFPADSITKEEVGAAVEELKKSGLVEEYEVTGAKYWHVTGWEKHQKIDSKTGLYPLPNGEIGTKIRRTFTEHSRNIRRTDDESSPNDHRTTTEQSPDVQPTVADHSCKEKEKEKEKESSCSEKLPNKQEISKSAKKYVFEEIDMRFSRSVFAKIRAILPNYREPNFEAWANEARLMRERDKRDLTEAWNLFLWANKDSFWCSNILSVSKLREQWDVLQIKRKTSVKAMVEDNYDPETGGHKHVVL